MDISLSVEKILPSAAYFGSVTANTPEAWEAVRWQDERMPKPSWGELQVAWVDLSRASAIEAVKEKSWRAEIGGMLVDGVPIPTDRESQALITGAVVGTFIDPDKVTRWQTAAVHEDGSPVFVDLTAAQLQGIGMAVRAHVQACFDLREAKCAEVAGLGTVEEVAAWLTEHLDTGWPEQGA